jgi:hypothetical protein
MEGLLAVCQGVFVATPGGLEIAMKGKSGLLTTPIFYCPYCGEKIVVKRGSPGPFDTWEDKPWYNKYHPKAEFKIGERVKYCGKLEKLHGTWEIVGLNQVEDNGTIEYALRGFPFLVWEDEIERGQ